MSVDVEKGEEKWLTDLKKYLEKNGRVAYAYDGIVDETVWESVCPKMLFLLKEPVGNEGFDLRKFLRKDLKNRKEDKTWRNVAMWVYAAFHRDEDLSYRDVLKPIGNSEEGCREWLSKIAAVNVKKQPGKSVTDTKVLKEEFRKYYAPYVAQQLRAFRDVDVIVCCGQGVSSCLISIFEEVFGVPYDKLLWKNYCKLGNLKSPVKFYKAQGLPLIVRYCHPAARVSDKEKAQVLQHLLREEMRD